MLEQLLGLVQENSQQAIVQNPAVPNEHNEEVMNTLMGSITGGLQEHAQAGNLGGLMGLLSGNSATSSSSLMNNPIVASIASKAIGAIMEKFGMNSQTAGGIVNSVLPGVLGGLISKVSNPGDSSIDFNDIIESLTKGSSAQAPAQSSGFDFNQIGYAMADGKLDMNDLIKMGGSLMGGGSSAPQSGQGTSGGLDLGGMLGGLFGNK
ncbi:hypothetical protein [Dyadobacter pollutisoli]|uniref:DUF937 domain-containing protein n=1 Tax=Dyadobacter pollutisoli TaxID=2910158 RepID=A0A9E8SP73_9BACT|nr:hypothetical protein [Dyadobacter pollutisoli]WAC14431.1 hypothetical protein ON006_10840 [Dyadobacter pollutisoli]